MKKGIYFSLLAAFVSGLSVFVNAFAVKVLTNPLVFTAIKNIVVAFLIFGLIILLKKKNEIKKLTKKDWFFLLLIGFIGGSIPFLLFFKGLSVSLQSASMGSFIYRSMFIWVGFLAFFFLKEKFSVFQYVGLIVILFGLYITGGSQSWSFGEGELYIFAATILWSAEAVFVKKLPPKITPQVAMFGRMYFGSIIMTGYLLITNNFGGFAFNTSQINWILATSILLFIYVNLYYSALMTEKATTVTSILTLSFPATVILQNIFKGNYIPKESFGILVMLAGIIIFFFISLRFAKDRNALVKL